ncbi:MAG: hypothetical protein MMC23_006476 [Stictis urceolatum]|nr:hypothetical protein [Stictis urceolata]
MLAVSSRLLPRLATSSNVLRANAAVARFSTAQAATPADEAILVTRKIQPGSVKEPRAGFKALGPDSQAACTEQGFKSKPSPQTSGIQNVRSHSRTVRISRHALIKIEEKETLKNGAWRQRVQSFEQLKYESDVEGPTPRGFERRLVDYDFLQNELSLWEILFAFRLRTNGYAGAAAIWVRLHSVRNSHALSILSSKPLVDGIIEAGMHDPALLHDFCRYVYNSHRLAGQKPPNEFQLYSKVLFHLLQTEPSKMQPYHALLEHLVTRCQLVSLTSRLIEAAKRTEGRKCLEHFRELCAGVTAFTEMYDYIVPNLCEASLFEDAVIWHNFLVDRNDTPSSAVSMEPLVTHLLESGRPQEARSIVRSAGESVKQSQSAPTVTKELERMRFGTIVKEIERASPAKSNSRTGFRDEFCARLLATRFFSVWTVVEGLRVLQVREIGPHSMRAILIRTIDSDCCNVERLREYLDTLSKASISIGGSKYCRLIWKLIADNNAQMLYDVAICDLHPDEFDNWRLQERLLVQYELAGDKRLVDRTMTILLLESSEAAFDTKYMNILLRNALNRKDETLFTKLLEAVRIRQLPVTEVTRRWVFVNLIPERVAVPGKMRDYPPHERLVKYIETMKSILLGGTPIYPREWDDAMRSLLHTERLAEFEELLFFLMKWYTDSDFQAAQTGGLLEVKGKSIQKVQSNWRQMIRPSRMHDIVLAGFFANSQRSCAQTSISGQGFDERAASLANHPTLWGLQLLAKAKNMGYPVEQEELARVCILRLVTMFSLGPQSRWRNRVVRANRKGTLQEYVAAMEMVWGSSLFKRAVPLDDFAAQVMYFGNRIWFNQVRGMLRTIDKYKLKYVVSSRSEVSKRLPLQVILYRKDFLHSNLKALEASGMRLERDRSLSGIFLPYKRRYGRRTSTPTSTSGAIVSRRSHEQYDRDVDP